VTIHVRNDEHEKYTAILEWKEKEQNEKPIQKKGGNLVIRPGKNEENGK
jgi:hypothetical protein